MQQQSEPDIRGWDSDPLVPLPPIGTIDGDREPDWMEWLGPLDDESAGEASADHDAVPSTVDGVGERVANPVRDRFADDDTTSDKVDDRLAVMAADARKATEARKSRKRRARYIVGGSAVFLVATAVGVGVTVFDTSPTTSSTTPAARTSTPTTAVPSAAALAPPAEQGCVSRTDATQVSGNGPGDTSSGPGLVLTMQYAMYVSRDADAVRSVLAPTAQAASADATRAAIAELPLGTTHCVWVTTIAPDRFGVKVEEHRPDSTTRLWETTVTTGVQSDGRLLITGITAG